MALKYSFGWLARSEWIGRTPPGETHGRYLVVLDAKTGCSNYKGWDDLGQP